MIVYEIIAKLEMEMHWTKCLAIFNPTGQSYVANLSKGKFWKSNSQFPDGKWGQSVSQTEGNI